MKKTLLTAVSAFLVICFSNAQSYDSLFGPRIWLRADRSELTTSSWSDNSFFKHHATGSTPASMPSAYTSINFNKALAFDGVDDYLKLPYSLENLAEVSVLAVFQSSDTTEFGIWGTEESPTRNILLTTRKAVGPDAMTDTYGNHGKIAILNSLLQNWESAAATASSSYIALGSAGKTRSFKPFRGSIAEFIVFNRALSFLERLQFETYLSIKYGTGLKGGNYVSSDKKLLWHVEQNAAYGKNIAGIGRDDFFKLYQKQSGSAYDSGLLIMNAGALAQSNTANTSTINNQDFILWGDNSATLNTVPGIGADSILLYLQRRWLATATGNTVQELPVELSIAQSKLPAEPLGYWLVIDRSGTGNFSIDNLEFIEADGVVNGRITYKNLIWDKDGSGKDNFGFAREKKLLTAVRRLNDPSCTNEKAGKVKIEVIAGKAPFHYTLTSKDGKISREWRQSATSIVQDELTKGEYTLTVKDGNKETLTRVFTLTMPDAISINLGPDQQFSAENPIVLDVTSQVPATIPVTYHWENSFGFSSDASKITVTETGVYRVFVTKESDGCVFTDDIAITGAEEQRIAVYPTVVNIGDDFHIGISLNEPGEAGVKVYNSRGFQVQEMKGLNNSEYQFITSMKDAGVYLVVIQTRKGIETRKVVVH